MDYTRRSHKRLNKAISWKKYNCTFSADETRHLPRHQPHGAAGPNTGGNVRLFTQCYLESTDAAWRVLVKWLKHSSKHSNETVVKKWLVSHVISNTFNIHLPEMPEMSSHGR